MSAPAVTFGIQYGDFRDQVTVNGTKVVGVRQADIANAGTGTEVATINAILTALRAHGLIG